MKTFIIVAGAAVGVYVLWRAVHAASAGISPVAAVLNPRLPIIAPRFIETRRGAGHF